MLHVELAGSSRIFSRTVESGEHSSLDSTIETFDNRFRVLGVDLRSFRRASDMDLQLLLSPLPWATPDGMAHMSPPQAFDGGSSVSLSGKLRNEMADESVIMKE